MKEQRDIPGRNNSLSEAAPQPGQRHPMRSVVTAYLLQRVRVKRDSWADRLDRYVRDVLRGLVIMGVACVAFMGNPSTWSGDSLGGRRVIAGGAAAEQPPGASLVSGTLEDVRADAASAHEPASQAMEPPASPAPIISDPPRPAEPLVSRARIVTEPSLPNVARKAQVRPTRGARVPAPRGAGELGRALASPPAAERPSATKRQLPKASTTQLGLGVIPRLER